MTDDFDSCYRAVQSRDARFDGHFFTAVRTTRIYCRPSCPARTPKPENVRFYRTAAAAQQAGFRACLRCRPDAAPGSPEWLGRADVAGRAMQLILDGAVDREGVSGLANRLGYSPRQLHRVLRAELGTGALSLARAQRAQTARVLLATSDVPITDVAFAAGFSSLRQFNDTIRATFARTPRELRRASRRSHGGRSGAITVRLPHREPLAVRALFEFLGMRAIPGVESFDGSTYRRSLRLPHGFGTVALRALPLRAPASGAGSAGQIEAEFALEDLRDFATAVARCRRLLNLDADPVAVDEALGSDPLLAERVAELPGLRVPGAVDGFELAVRAIVGQQVSVAGARTVIGAIVRACGELLPAPVLPLTHAFPSPQTLARTAHEQPGAFAMPSSRRETLGRLATAVAQGELVIEPGADPGELSERLQALRGIGPWTAGYIAMRALGDPDAFLASDLGVLRSLSALGRPGDARAAEALAERWRPWRAHAVVHLWQVPPPPAAARGAASGRQARTGSSVAPAAAAARRTPSRTACA